MPCRAATLALLWVASIGPARQPDVSALPKSLDPVGVDAYVARQLAEKGFVGLSLAVARNGQIILARSYGTTALPDGAAVTPETPFAIGSVTKQFACAAVLMLADDGKLSPRDPVAKWYPNLTRANEITLYDLMSHASGYPDYYPLDFLDRRMMKPIAPDDLIREYAGGKLDFPPGSRWSYSNTGYIIMGRVVEKVSGEPFGKFVERRIFKPLGMTHTLYEPAPDSRQVARGHMSYLLGPAEAARPEAAGWLGAAGGIYSTASDLVRWDLGLIEGKVLKPESYRLMTTPRELSSGKTADYGCGLSVTRRGGEAILAHNGAVSGSHAYNSMVPRTRSAVVLLSNAEHVDAGALHREVFGLLLKDEARREAAVPVVNGPPVKDAVRDFFEQLRAGAVDRGRLGEEFNLYLTDERVREAEKRLRDLGEPTAVEVENTVERGGMEATRTRLAFKNGVVSVNMFRSPDGKVQQFLLSRGS